MNAGAAGGHLETFFAGGGRRKGSTHNNGQDETDVCTLRSTAATAAIQSDCPLLPAAPVLLGAAVTQNDEHLGFSWWCLCELNDGQ